MSDDTQVGMAEGVETPVKPEDPTPESPAAPEAAPAQV